MILSPLDSLRETYENFNQREKRLVNALGAVVVALLIALPLWLVSSSISSVAAENDEIRQVLGRIAREQDQIAQVQALKAAAERRYDVQAPPLASFLEEQARQAGYERTVQVTPQPDRAQQDFRRRHVTAELPGIDLRTAINLMASIKNSRYPVAIESVRIEHFSRGDRFNIELGVIAFDREGDDDDDDDEGPARRRDGRAGPP